MEFAGNQEGKVIRVPQLRRGKEDVAVSERVIIINLVHFITPLTSSQKFTLLDVHPSPQTTSCLLAGNKF